MSKAAAESRRRSWEPDHDDHRIYWWVKFQGKSQAWVANDMGIHQGTVSRVIQRYERWQARTELHAGGLSREERLRAQRWLTYERNELILASCLRIANDIEGFVDSSRSTTVRPLSNPSGEREVRAEHFTIDRTGMVSRYLRLAFKINIEQLKLVESDEPPPLPGLTADQIAAEEEAAARDRAELAAVREQRRRELEAERRWDEEAHQAAVAQEKARAEEAGCLAKIEEAQRLALAEELLRQEAERAKLEAAVQSPPAASAHSAHNAHNEQAPLASANSEEPSTYRQNGHPKKKTRPARMAAAAASQTKNKPRRGGPPAIAELRLTPEQAVTLETG